MDVNVVRSPGIIDPRLDAAVEDARRARERHEPLIKMAATMAAAGDVDRLRGAVSLADTVGADTARAIPNHHRGGEAPVLARMAETIVEGTGVGQGAGADAVRAAFAAGWMSTMDRQRLRGVLADPAAELFARFLPPSARHVQACLRLDTERDTPDLRQRVETLTQPHLTVGRAQGLTTVLIGGSDGTTPPRHLIRVFVPPDVAARFLPLDHKSVTDLRTRFGDASVHAVIVEPGASRAAVEYGLATERMAAALYPPVPSGPGGAVPSSLVLAHSTSGLVSDADRQAWLTAALEHGLFTPGMTYVCDPDPGGSSFDACAAWRPPADMPVRHVAGVAQLAELDPALFRPATRRRPGGALPWRSTNLPSMAPFPRPGRQPSGPGRTP